MNNSNGREGTPTILVILGVVFALIIGGAYFWGDKGAPPVSFASPNGGEIWQAGSMQKIKWTANVPKEYKVAINIRRIPPPPLQEKGQEFDPIVFTNLPNSGEADWKISPMYPDGNYVLGLSVYKELPATEEISAESPQFKISHPELLLDLYPLWSGAEWQKTETEDFVIGVKNYSGTSIFSFPVADINSPANAIDLFTKYYDQKLKALGWQMDNSLAAGGHVGGQTGYEKNGNIVLVRFKIDYKNVFPDKPSECPCDLTFSLFSGK